MNYDYICYFDGACEPRNPGGNMGIGAIILDKEKNIISKLSRYIRTTPNNSNNVAEYQGFGWVITELNRLIPKGATILIHGDSKLVIEQMNGNWQIKKGFYVQFAHRSKVILEELKSKCKVEIRWIPRAQNELADELSKSPMIENGCEFRIQPLDKK